jgi:hypothetical protein
VDGSPSEGPRFADLLASFADHRAPPFSPKRKYWQKILATGECQGKAQSKVKGKGGNLHARSLGVHRMPMGGFAHWLRVWRKKPAWAVKGLSRHILDRRRDACLRYSTVPLTWPVFRAIFQPPQTLIPLVYDALQGRGRSACQLGFVAASRQFKSF